MPAEFTASSRTALDASTDQVLALTRDKRAQITEPGDIYLQSLADGLADMLRAQFPDVPGLGRITASLAQHLQGMSAGMTAAGGIGVHLATEVGALTVIVLLAGERLDRESGAASGVAL